MKRQDRELLADLARLNTALPTFALRVMDHSATVAEHHAIAAGLLVIAQVIQQRALKLTIIDPQHDDSAAEATKAFLPALSALVGEIDDLDTTTLATYPEGKITPGEWPA